jgi:hypothetical protein
MTVELHDGINDLSRKRERARQYLRTVFPDPAATHRLAKISLNDE